MFSIKKMIKQGLRQGTEGVGVGLLVLQVAGEINPLIALGAGILSGGLGALNNYRKNKGKNHGTA